MDKLNALEASDTARPPLSYSEIYESIVNCKNSEAVQKPQPKLSAAAWLKYRWNGKRVGKKVVRSRRANGLHEQKRAAENQSV